MVKLGNELVNMRYVDMGKYMSARVFVYHRLLW